MHKVYQQIEEIRGNVITVEAEGIAYRELAQVTSGAALRSLRSSVSMENGFICRSLRELGE